MNDAILMRVHASTLANVEVFLVQTNFSAALCKLVACGVCARGSGIGTRGNGNAKGESSCFSLV